MYIYIRVCVCVYTYIHAIGSVSLESPSQYFFLSGVPVTEKKKGGDKSIYQGLGVKTLGSSLPILFLSHLRFNTKQIMSGLHFKYIQNLAETYCASCHHPGLSLCLSSPGQMQWCLN